MPIEKKKKRMVFNGVRLREGEDNDWYEDIVGRIVIPYVKSIDSRDVIIFEYADFCEEVLNHKDVYLQCKCGIIIPTSRTICGPCQHKELLYDIKAAHSRIATLEKGIRQKESAAKVVLKEWYEYLEEEDKRAASRRRNTES